MKLKKFNTAVAVIVLAGIVTISSIVGYAALKGGSSLKGARPAVPAVSAADRDAKGAVSYSSKDRRVVQIPWQKYHNKIPGKASLVKWEEGDRVYYQITGPVNKDMMIAGDYKSKGLRSRWGDNAEMEIFFHRSGKRYDQWVINPVDANVFHWNGRVKNLSISKLPKSRYTCAVKGNQVVTTFWCHKDDAPGNIVFNYNNGDDAGSGGGRLAWATTSLREDNHHDSEKWTHP